ncbi:T9SS type B sorting domain-containing protein [Flavobacterium sp. XN-5]|uniref:T9SS type B sorting domain-containing protein n=1 Tax=Flavobacterium sp. XN-5 TaxID=2599390 RepID=UPI0011C75ACA|nr:T9SS type B sorting domain-containing protein [Flavobacterium sp. XN-5]NGY38365.1 T9SS type B sorting domain-containing protein [Flavobacterium sp. XN-5]
MKKAVLIFFTFLSISSFAQLSKTHFIPPLTSSSSAGVTPQDHYIYISSPSTTTVKFKIIEIGGNIIEGTVNNNMSYRHDIGSGINTPLFVSSIATGLVSNKGYIIEAEGLIYASVRTNSGGGNQAGGLVAKGNSALGKRFRAGAMLNTSNISTLLNFFTILATENNTTVTISNIFPGTLLANGTTFNGPQLINLNKNQSYILAIDGSAGFNLIGALIESDKNVVVNSGSFGGTNDPTNANNAGRDLGFDQIVGADKIGTEYIFIKGNGYNELERVLIIADEDDTEIFANGLLIGTIQNGQNYIFDGSAFSNGSLYVKTSKKVFAYQSIGETSNANQNLFFVPPLNCSTPKVVDNIPEIDKIGSKSYTGTINIVTETGATLEINNSPIVSTPTAVAGNSKFVFYSINSRFGNISIKSTKQVYVSYSGTNINATYGGYYSGFDLKPEILSENNLSLTGNCIPNIKLKTSPDIDYSFQWIFNGSDIPGAISDSFPPTQAGYYQVRRSIFNCSSTLSDRIPVSDCPIDTDGDGVNDNIDIDLDNDGILNTVESTFNFINQTNTLLGTNFNGTMIGDGIITGKTNFGFVSEVPLGITKTNTYSITFIEPRSISFEYITADTSTQTTPESELLNNEGDFILRVAPSQTLTLTDPDGQLEVDTNYDGVFESGVTEFSSFEIRFRLKGTTPHAAGAGTFKIESYLATKVEFVHTNLSDTNINKATFLLKERITKDTDGDGITDDLDTDTDNDGIPDTIEAQPNNSVSWSNSDTNKNGLDNAFEPGFTPVDTDADGIPDYLDLDSDNDGILDSIETGSLGTDTNADGIKNYRDLDSDGDLCLDVIEAGFLDPDGDGRFGSSPFTANANGLVIGAPYTIPNPNYIIAAPIEITVQPQALPTCELQNTVISVTDNGGNTYLWQIAIDGINWNNITNNSTYSGVTTNTLLLTSISNTMNGYKYRVQLSKIGNSCGLTSAETSLIVYTLPTVSPTTIVQCDDDADGISDFNLTEKNSFISANSGNETFTFYKTLSGADSADSSLLITTPKTYTSANGSVWARVENTNGCFSVAQLDLIVSTTRIPASFSHSFSECDDFIDAINDDKDGVATFNFTAVTDEIKTNYLSSSSLYSIKYYKNEADALAELNEITNTTNYRNIGYPNQQRIWVRVESTLDNACYGLGPHVVLTVNPKPNIDINKDHTQDNLVCSNLPTFFVTLDAGINDGSPTNDFTYVWSKDSMDLGETNPTLDVNVEGNYSVKVSTVLGCSRTRNIKVTASDVAKISNIDIVDLSTINTVTVNVTGQGQYEYSIDEPSGPFQTSNFFDNVPAGIHDVYINDINGCGTVSTPISVIGVPKYFTPNNDGYNDYWNVKGITTNFNANSTIYIYDRYGKLLKQLIPTAEGWDGTFNGLPLPSDDYWYTVKLEDGREAKGHFSLKR